MKYFYNQLFGKICEVHLLENDEYVFPIYKNGQSAIRQCSKNILYNQQIQRLENVTVYMREAEQRYCVGVATYIEHNANLDSATLLHLINTRQLLNNHFCSQYHWLQHLRRFAPNIILDIKDYTQIPITEKVNVSTRLDIPKVDIDTHWCAIDNKIYNTFVGTSITFEEIDKCIALA
jgi:hypothetical protein